MSERGNCCLGRKENIFGISFLLRFRLPGRLGAALLMMFFVLGCSKSKTQIPDITDEPAVAPVSVKNMPEAVPGYGVVTDGAVEVNLEAKDGSRVSVGDKALVWSDNAAKFFACRVAKVLPNVNLATGQAIAWLKPVSEFSLPVGKFISAQIIVRVKTGVLTLPIEAVYVKDGQSVVLLKQTLKDGTISYVPTPIKTGIVYEGNVEIVSGLKPGDQVATQGGIGYLYANFKADADD